MFLLKFDDFFLLKNLEKNEKAEIISTFSNPILFKKTDYFTEFGVGCTFYTQYLRFSLEANYSIGFNNKFVPFEKRLGTPHEPLTSDIDNINRAAQCQSIESLRARVFTFVFNINI